MPDGRQLIVTRHDEKTHELYDVATGQRVHRFPGNVAVGRPFVDETGQTLTSVGRDAGETIVVRQWDVPSTRLKDTIALGIIKEAGAVRRATGGFWNATVAPSANRVAVSGGYKVWRWNTLTKEELPNVRPKGGTEETLALTEDGRGLYTSGRERFGLYDTESAKAIREFAGPTGAVAVSPDKKHVVSCGRGVVIWDMEHGLPIVTLSDTDETNFIAVDWSPDHRHIAAAKDDGSVTIWTLFD